MLHTAFELFVTYYFVGNIVLHLMLPRVRHLYDIEGLWTCGPEYDNKMHEETQDIFSVELEDIDLTDLEIKIYDRTEELVQNKS